MTLALLVLAAALAASHQPTMAGKVKKVRIIVATRSAHEQQCKAGKYQAVDILVDQNPDEKLPFSCVNGQVIDHKTAHAKHEQTIVKLSFEQKESAFWYSDTEFAISAISVHEDKNPESAPPNPFFTKIPTATSKSIESGPIRKEAIDHRYKITLKIGSRSIDPDLWCQP